MLKIKISQFYDQNELKRKEIKQNQTLSMWHI